MADPAESVASEAIVQKPGIDYSPAYARYVLVVLVLVYILNFLDRQILSILAEDIKADLGLTDAQLGFLYGTVFAVFYAVCGIPLARLADIWVRRNLIAIGLGFWSLMTALSGTARSFTMLAIYRIGVGVGESSASPAAFSLLCDYFSPRVRATVMAIYSSGVYIGLGLGIVVGGAVVESWNSVFPDGTAPFGLAGWQAAFFAVGLPGLLLAMLVATLREPVRGQAEGLVAEEGRKQIWREFGIEFAAVIPPVTLLTLFRAGGRPKDLGINIAAAAALALLAALLGATIGSAVQWIALGIALYAFFSWVQILKQRDPAVFGMIFRSRAIVYGMIGFSWHAFLGYAAGFWTPPYLLRVFDVSAAEVGLAVGGIFAVGGWLGATAGGVGSDWLKRRTPRARLYVGMLSAGMSLPFTVGIFLAESYEIALLFVAANQLVTTLWIGSAVALSNEPVMPRMRAASGVFYIIVITFVGLALGPYTVGQLSTYFSATMGPGESLRTALLIACAAELAACLFLWLSSRYVEDEETHRIERARSYGEPVPDTV